MSPTARNGDGAEIQPGAGVVPVLKEIGEGCLKVVGTGFYITRYGLFATAAHVLEDLADHDRTVFGVGYVFEHRGEDGIVIRRIIRASLSNIADIGLGQAENMARASPGTPNLRARLSFSVPQHGERLVTYAYPENEVLDFTCETDNPILKADYFEGEFRRQVSPGEHPFIPYPHYETSLEVRSGASGGPVFNRRGEIVAIACRGWDFRGGEHEGDNLSAVVPVGYLLSMNETCARPCSPSWEYDRIPHARRGASLSIGELVAYGHIDVGMFRW